MGHAVFISTFVSMSLLVLLASGFLRWRKGHQFASQCPIDASSFRPFLVVVCGCLGGHYVLPPASAERSRDSVARATRHLKFVAPFRARVLSWCLSCSICVVLYWAREGQRDCAPRGACPSPLSMAGLSRASCVRLVDDLCGAERDIN